MKHTGLKFFGGKFYLAEKIISQNITAIVSRSQVLRTCF